MKPTDVVKALNCCIAISQPALCWGSPGIGKSDIVRQLAKSLGRDVVEIRASLFDAVDLRGIPTAKDGKTTWLTPDFLPTGEKATILFLDEMNRAPVMVQNALFQLILDRRLGDYKLPDNCEIIAACNRESDGGGIIKMPQALANRFVHLEMEVDVDDWCKWAAQSDIEPVVIAFLRFRRELIHKFSRDTKAFPSPRSWSFVSKITAAKPGNGIEHALYCGAVGDGAAVEYSAFLRMYRELASISIDAIMLNPLSVQVPTQPGALFAVSSALGNQVSHKNIGRVLQYFNRLPKEFEVYGIKDALNRDQSLSSTPEFTLWAINNQEVLS